ncbi:MAG: hypothetical protein BWY75_00915 [bacterium ADurb.Bin425]|uniref:Uncharacterized protein n=1 Tax=Candidatus Obscuribacter phosphatis TaxID=1906157 RepID=A0A8J7TLL8_9BACT|nr:hypothetical protein [Candidatus Obscuribacter phosphatis]OPZ90001.1 MAG: hypothetical protein BWY75_00915 [bacterium ADurb.Bin425]
MNNQDSFQKNLNLAVGWLLYPTGDFLGQLILHPSHISIERLLAITLMGGLVYRFEIPRWFKTLDSIKFDDETIEKFQLLKLLTRENPAETAHKQILNWLGRTLGAMLYFNPLWISRHIYVIFISTNHQFMPSNMTPLAAVGHFLAVGGNSFLINLPISFLGNYIIQQRLPITYRFLGSATLSSLMAILYAVAYWLFHH